MQVTSPAELSGRLLEALFRLPEQDAERGETNPEQTGPIDIFISHSSRSRGEARELAQGLTARGFSVWTDADILPGADIRAVIDEAIGRSKAILLVIDPEQRSSPWMEREWISAINHAWAGEKLVIPVLLSDAQPPAALQTLHALRLADTPPDSAVEILTRAIRSNTDEGLVSTAPEGRAALRERMSIISEITERLSLEDSSDERS